MVLPEPYLHGVAVGKDREHNQVPCVRVHGKEMRGLAWFKTLLSRFVCIDSFCKICGVDVRDFIVDEDVWDRVQAHIPRGNTLCYNCFCDACQVEGLPSLWKLERLTK